MRQGIQLSRFFVGILSLAASAPRAAVAERASPEPFVVENVGKNITLFVKGGDFIRLLRDENNFPVVRKNEDGIFYYADLQDGLLGPTEYIVGQVDPVEVGLEPALVPLEEAYIQFCIDNLLLCAEFDANFDPGFGIDIEIEKRRKLQTTDIRNGTLKNLAVLLIFSDHVDRPLPSEADIDVMLNNEGPDPILCPTGSVRDYYANNSYGQLDMVSTVHKYVVVNNTEKYYAGGESGMVSTIWEALTDALNQLEADPDLDFADFDQNGDGYIDAISFIMSGYSASTGGYDEYGTYADDRIWPHKWEISPAWESQSSGVKVSHYHISSALYGKSGTDINHIGSICHETGHFLGAPDLYDTDSSEGNGLGSYCLMANNWGFDGTQQYPPHMSAWIKEGMGWVTPTVIDSPGEYTISANELQNPSHPQVYRIEQGYREGEYLLIENRQPLFFDSKMPQGGLAIYHVDNTLSSSEYQIEGFPEQPGWPANGNHYRVEMLQADSLYELQTGFDNGDEGDVFHGDGVDFITQSDDPKTGPFPNTDSWGRGGLQKTGNRIYDISPAGNEMTFKFEIISGSLTESTSPPMPTGAPTTSAAHQPALPSANEILVFGVLSAAIWLGWP